MSFAPVPLAQSNLDSDMVSMIGSCAPKTAYQASIQSLPPRVGVAISSQALNDPVYGLGQFGACPGLSTCNANSAASNVSSQLYNLNNPLPALNQHYVAKLNLPRPDAAWIAQSACVAKATANNMCLPGPLSTIQAANNQAFTQTTKLPQLTGSSSSLDRTSEISLSGPVSQQLLDTSVLRMRPTATPMFSQPVGVRVRDGRRHDLMI